MFEIEEGKSWLYTTITLLAGLVIVYLSLHWFLPVNGLEETGFTSKQIDFIIDVSLNDTLVDKQAIIENYLVHSGFAPIGEGNEGTEVIGQFFDQLNQVIQLETSQLRDYLQEYRYDHASPFWLKGGLLYLEIFFWSLFGVLASLLFHGTEAIRKGEFDKRELSVHLGKLFYSPLISIVLLTFFSSLIRGEANTLEGIDHWYIALSFVFGFYSRRAIDLLDRFKDIIFRASDTNQPVTTENGSHISTVTDTNYASLSEEEQHRLVVGWLTHKSKAFIEEYGLTGATAGFKEKGGKDTGIYAIQFEVVKKQQTNKALPRTVDYKSYRIPTDVVESPKTESTSTTTPLETKVSRHGTTDFGTLGIKANYKGKEVLMGCYHVYFPHELSQKQRETNTGSIKGNADVLAGKSKTVIGKVSYGILNDWLDIGLVEVDPAVSIPDEWASRIGPYGKRELKFGDQKKNIYVQYWGAGSGKLVLRKVVGVFSTQPIDFKHPTGIYTRTLYGLIKLDGPAVGGDSGAPVFDTAGYMVGMIIASNKKNAYMISMEAIEDLTEIKVKTKNIS